MHIWETTFQAQEKRYKGPEVAAFLTCLKQRGEPNEAGVA